MPPLNEIYWKKKNKQTPRPKGLLPSWREKKNYPGCAGSMQSAGIDGDIRHFWIDNSNHQSEKAEMGQGHWAVTEGF